MTNYQIFNGSLTSWSQFSKRHCVVT